MTDAEAGHRWRALLASGLLAAAAVALRLAVIGFPVDAHPDEPIFAWLAQRNLHQTHLGSLSANWAFVGGMWWTRATYQFSPFTFAETAMGAIARGLWGPVDTGAIIMATRVFSAVVAGLAGIPLFALSRALGGSRAAALFAQILWSLSPLTLQDGAYARPDALMGALVNVALALAFLGLRDARPRLVLGAALVAGIAAAAKYNAWTGAAAAVGAAALLPMPGTRRVRLLLGVAAAGLIGFVAATPEVLRDPAPLVAGLKYEWLHYQATQYAGYAPQDRNLPYWTRYFASIGLGVLPLAALVVGLATRIRPPRRAPDMLFVVLTVLAVAASVQPLTRFERNWELALGLMCAAAALGWDLVWRRSTPLRAGRAGALVATALFVVPLAQPALACAHLAATMQPERSPLAHLTADGVVFGHVELAVSNPGSWDGRTPVAVLDYGDPQAEHAMLAWKARAAGCPAVVRTSYWGSFGYPYSTVDVYHGPRWIYFLFPCEAAARRAAAGRVP